MSAWENRALIEEAKAFVDPGLVQDNGYRPFDQDIRIRHWGQTIGSKLTPDQWYEYKSDLVEWEKVHGHSAQLKCYPEFQCAAIELYAHNLIARLTVALAQSVIGQ